MIIKNIKGQANGQFLWKKKLLKSDIVFKGRSHQKVTFGDKGDIICGFPPKPQHPKNILPCPLLTGEL